MLHVETVVTFASAGHIPGLVVVEPALDTHSTARYREPLPHDFEQGDHSVVASVQICTTGIVTEMLRVGEGDGMMEFVHEAVSEVDMDSENRVVFDDVADTEAEVVTDIEIERVLLRETLSVAVFEVVKVTVCDVDAVAVSVSVVEEESDGDAVRLGQMLPSFEAESIVPHSQTQASSDGDQMLPLTQTIGISSTHLPLLSRSISDNTHMHELIFV